MADKKTATNNLKLAMYFKDGDTRTLTLTNSRRNITGEEVVEIGTWMKTNQPVIGDKGSSEFVRFNSATRVEIMRTVVDLNL